MIHWLIQQWDNWWCILFHDPWTLQVNYRNRYTCTKPNCRAERAR